MMTSAHDHGTCLYGARYISGLLKSFSAEIEGVRAADDIESVHRMRVASRRIRAALPLFRDCFSGKEYRFWNKEVRAITRALGAARDADVQIEFLLSIIGNVGERDSATRNGAELPQEITVAAEPATRDLLLGLECLLVRLQQKRARLQPEVIAGIDRLESTGVVGVMEDTLAGYLERERFQNTDVRSPAAYVHAFSHITQQIDEVFRFEPFIAMPDRTGEHHAMRIAVKRLRYTMEVFRDLYDCGIKEPLTPVKHLQDVLGELHDCDVWLGCLPEFLDSEKERQQEYFGHLEFFRIVEPGIRYLIDDRNRRRQVLHALLVRTWTEQKEERLWESLRETISTPLLGRKQDTPAAVALIGDVRGNHPALAAVLEDARARGATLVLNAGDSIGDEPSQNEVVRMLKTENIISVIGNLDRDVIGARRIQKTSRSRKRRKALLRVRRGLSRKNRRYLRTLPETVRLTLFGKRLLLTHGSPASITEYITKKTPDQRLKDLAAEAEADIIVTGHSRRPFVTEVDGVWFVNTGSAGKPGDGDSRAGYALLRQDPFAIEHIPVAYDEAPQEMHGEEDCEPDTIKGHKITEPTAQQIDRTTEAQQSNVEQHK
ncbi:MAG: hypothetical protein PWR21_1337 [Methanoculleus sp.]|nr:hypothetical protein [Methanoculleus sp.]